MRPRSRNAGWRYQFTGRCLLDDRGRRVSAVRMSRWWPPPGAPVLPAEIRWRIQPLVTASAAFRYHGWRRALLFPFAVTAVNLIALLPLYAIFLLVVWPVTSSRTNPVPIGWSVCMMALWFAVVVTVPVFASMPFHRWYWHPIIIPTILEERHCGSCGYSLVAAAPEADGRTVCSECGAAWRLP